MTDKERYIPLSERLNQDVIHDNFVPKYSALANAQPSKLVVAGVWLIFGPMVIASLIMPFSFWSDTADLPSNVLSILMPLFFGLISVAILWTQTRRYLNRDRDPLPACSVSGELLMRNQES